MRNTFFLVCLYFLLINSASARDSLLLPIPFYAQEVVLLNTSSPIPTAPSNVEGNKLINWYQQIKDQWPHHLLLQSIQSAKDQLSLNDWLFYELIRATSKRLSPGDRLQQRLLNWFLLSESGYDTRITFLSDQIYLYAYIEEGIFDTPMIQDGSKKFVNLSSIHEKMSNPTASLNMLPYEASSYGRAFSFDLDNWPLLTPQLKQVMLSFNWREENFSFPVEIDQTVAHFMKHYPIFEEQRYLEIPLSPTLNGSLLPALKKIIADKSQKESLEILVAFTRSVFAYKEDQDHFGKNKPMIADELFHYPYSDCEDRSALFYNLVRSLLDLPMIIIAYPNHLTIGVALSEEIGPSIRYQGKSYYICDPTGPSNSAKIGMIPEGYEKTSFEILGNYK